MARILIAGCGYVGSGLAERLLAAGHEVVALRRDPSRLSPELIRIAADLTDPSQLAQLGDLPAPFDYVFFTASSDASTEDAYRAIYVRGLSNLIRVLAERGAPKRLFYTSSTAVYGQDDGSWVDEDSPTEPRSFHGRILLESERLVHTAPFPGTVVRLSGIYGPERSSLLRRLQEGTLRVATRPAFSNRIHRDDCAGVLAHLMTLDDPAPVYLASDDEPVYWHVLFDWLADRLGVARPERDEDARPPSSSKRCSNARLRASGYAMQYPTFRDGYAPILERFRASSGKRGTQ